MEQQQQQEAGDKASGWASQDEWSRVAKQYRGLGNLSHLHARENINRLQLTLEDRFVVDVAAGTGAFALQAAAELKRLRGEAGQSMDGVRLLATDFAEAMVGACRFEAESQGLNDIVECKQMDGQNLCEIEDGSVDALGCVFGVMFFPDVVKGLSEMRRVLRPGGRAAIAVWIVSAVGSMFIELSSRLNAHFGLTDRNAFQDMARTAFKLGDAEYFKTQLRAAGFGDDQMSLAPFEADWRDWTINDSVIGWAIDSPAMKASYPPERRDEAVAIFTQLFAEWAETYKGVRWPNRSLIAVVRK